jgi:hypothetical protein
MGLPSLLASWTKVYFYFFISSFFTPFFTHFIPPYPAP